VLYLRLYFIAAIPILVQNFASGMLNTAGNTRSSLYFMLVGGTSKVILNILFCLILPNKVLAVALGTGLSQLIWAILALLRLSTGQDSVYLHLNDLKPDWGTLRLILSQGIPISLYRCLFPLANLQITAAVNSFGAVVIAGNSAAVALEFDDQYQGGIDDRLREIVQERIDGVVRGVTNVVITEERSFMDQLEMLGDRLESATDLTDLQNELNAIINQIEAGMA